MASRGPVARPGTDPRDAGPEGTVRAECLPAWPRTVVFNCRNRLESRRPLDSDLSRAPTAGVPTNPGADSHAGLERCPMGRTRFTVLIFLGSFAIHPAGGWAQDGLSDVQGRWERREEFQGRVI